KHRQRARGLADIPTIKFHHTVSAAVSSKFSRSQEATADAEALKILEWAYGQRGRCGGVFRGHDVKERLARFYEYFRLASRPQLADKSDQKFQNFQNAKLSRRIEFYRNQKVKFRRF
ncbi:hypothetical protein, partial [uncultured Campylobacter sp.]|uniref:hypothetical protein n=1 Tax=uncultured Campylobacter sp. TaxID=218934 RepID=UPI00262E9491